jgi:hypothetical protein
MVSKTESAQCRTHELSLTETWDVIHRKEGARRANSARYNAGLKKVTVVEARREVASAGGGRPPPDPAAMWLSKVTPEMAAATLALLPEEEKVRALAGLEEGALSKLMAHMGADAPVSTVVDAEAKKRIPEAELRSGKGVYVGPMDLYKQNVVDIRKMKAEGVNIAYASRKGAEATVPTVSTQSVVSMTIKCSAQLIFFVFPYIVCFITVQSIREGGLGQDAHVQTFRHLRVPRGRGEVDVVGHGLIREGVAWRHGSRYKSEWPQSRGSDVLQITPALRWE